MEVNELYGNFYFHKLYSFHITLPHPAIQADNIWRKISTRSINGDWNEDLGGGTEQMIKWNTTESFQTNT